MAFSKSMDTDIHKKISYNIDNIPQGFYTIITLCKLTKR